MAPGRDWRGSPLSLTCTAATMALFLGAPQELSAPQRFKCLPAGLNLEKAGPGGLRMPDVLQEVSHPGHGLKEEYYCDCVSSEDLDHFDVFSGAAAIHRAFSQLLKHVMSNFRC